MARLNKFWDRHAAGYAKRPVADDAGFQIDDQWQPDKNKAAFIIATKA